MLDPLKNGVFTVVPSPEDERDYMARDILGLGPIAETTPQTEGEYWAMHRDKINVLDQGSSSMCTGFTVVQQIRQFHMMETGKLEDFSYAFTYGDRGEGDYEGEGDHLRNTAKQLFRNGTCLRKDFDLIGSYPQVRARFLSLSDEIMDKAKQYKIKSYYRVKIGAEYPDEVKEVFDKYNSILAGAIPLYQSFTEAYRNGGIVPIPDKDTEKYYGGHAVAIVGYKFIDGKLYYIIANSWGTEYGDEGFFYLPFDYPWFESWLFVDYKKIELRIPLDEKYTAEYAYLNGLPVKMHAPAFVEDGRTMVPVRTISELYGMEVNWIAESRSVIISEYLTNIWLTIDSKYIINSRTLETVEMDVAPFIQENRTYVPLRFVSEILNMNVTWDGETRTVLITNY